VVTTDQLGRRACSAVAHAQRGTQPGPARWSFDAIGAPWTVDTDLVVSELVTNAILHGGGIARLRLDLDGERLHIRVEDHNHRLPQRLPNPSTEPHGRGLWIVDALSESWGTELAQEADSKHVGEPGSPSPQALSSDAHAGIRAHSLALPEQQQEGRSVDRHLRQRHLRSEPGARPGFERPLTAVSTRQEKAPSSRSMPHPSTRRRGSSTRCSRQFDADAELGAFARCSRGRSRLFRIALMTPMRASPGASAILI
jgi:hypothetical protein